MVKIRSRCSLGDAEHRADLAMSKSFNVVQDDQRPLALSEPGERFSQSPAQLVRLAGIPEWSRRGFRQLVRVADLASPDKIQRRIRHDAIEPSPERLIGKKSVQRSKCVEESLLHR